ncbi:MAG TPA: hypothetical protein VFW96_10800 [Thermomicrobiales bacterium]|nr:hypothetical protein [Thermomicrobiales bacterium]
MTIGQRARAAGAAEAESRRARGPWWTPPAILLAYLALTFACTFPLGLQVGRVIPGKTTDGWQFTWNVWWAKESLLVLHTNPFVTQYLYFPDGVSLYFHTLGLGAAFLTIPLQFVLSAPATLLLTMLLLTALSGFAAYWFVYEQVPNRLAAFAGGLIFAVNPYQIDHLMRGQMNMTAICWIPVYLLLLLRAARTGRAGWAVGAGLTLILVALSDWQYAVYCLLFTAAFLLWRLLRAGDRRARLGLVRTGALAGVAFAIPIAPLVLAMIRDLRQGGDYAVRPYAQVVLHSMDVLALALPNPHQPLWGGLIAPLYNRLYHGTNYAGIGALGYVAVALALVALARRRRAAGFWLAMFLVFAVLALGPQLQVGGATVALGGRPFPLPYRLYGALPFVDVSRSPDLFLKFGLLMLAVPAALGLDALMVALAARRRAVALATGVALTALLSFEYLSAPLAAPPVDPTPAFYQQLAATPPGAYGILDVPSVKRDFPMYDQTIHHWPIVGGNPSRDNPHPFYDEVPGVAALVSGRYPLAAQDIFAGTGPADIGAASLVAYHIRYVIVHDDQLAPDERAKVARALAQIFPGQAPVFTGDGIRVFEVTRRPDGVMPFRLSGDWFTVQQLPDSKRPYRWIGKRAELHIYAPGDTAATLAFTAHNYATSYTLDVRVNGRPVGAYKIGAGFVDLRVPLALHADDNAVEFAVREAPHSAADLGLGTDTRRVSVGISQVRVER